MDARTDLIQAAFEAVKDLPLPENLREIAFQELIRSALSADQTTTAVSHPFDGTNQTPISGESGNAHTQGNSGAAQDGTASTHEQIAAAIGLRPDDALVLFEFGKDGSVQLGIPSRALPESKAVAAREVALVIAAANQALGRETRASDIRGVLSDYGRFDSANFMSSLKKLPSEQLAVRGRPGGKDLLILIRKPGVEEVPAIVRRWLGGGA